MALFSSKNTKRLELPNDPGLWVEIRTALTVGMKQRTLSAAMTLRVSDAGDASFDAFAYKQALLREIVVAWADPLPVTPSNVDELDPDVAEWVLEQFEALSAPRPEEETAPLGDNSSDGLLPATLSTPPAPGPESSTTSRSSNGLKTEVSSPA